MLSITIDTYVNGFGVRVYNSSEYGYEINEFHEEYVDAVKAVEHFVENIIIGELKAKVENASAL